MSLCVVGRYRAFLAIFICGCNCGYRSSDETCTFREHCHTRAPGFRDAAAVIREKRVLIRNA
jgi:hypothetical protein